ncbi:spermidine/putrescine transport system substrate-binding protein [Microbacteriaceae bacterium SG_E_30_P1]|uniref:Spermidine/putrescine transport system substrate-binding protein n=1 Tax=Antiquaquibacter oligotrophicus TaxID=2880260 RepID=A0ABT6KN49_9MICO|nr:spermidine/putrescine ABC transporter substrate-binding protein [Antiquaquibacter oligotrophicus]MDH6180579.1 spermidine/putrescine transport system substrate-binding protein [Antiquaquibacter oligotrophicus]UDF13688.1 spermidine/putrescine ABC transporter substrate-binding protein [Antiquaquibacter oligotrophicus]
MPRELPQDPMIRQLVLQAKRAQLSRRHVLQGMGIGAGALALAACAPSGGTAPTPAEDNSANDPTLVWGNWPAYLDEDDSGASPTLMRFEEESGIAVEYRVDIDDNNTFYGTIKDQLALGQYPGFDTFCLTEWMVARLIRFGYVQDLDEANIPNKANLAPSLLEPDFDPGRMKSLPWQNGFAGLAWDTEAVPAGLESLDDLWSPELKGKVTVLSELRDTMGVILLANGVDISSSDWGTDEYGAAIEVLEKQVTDGQILGIKGNEYMQDFVAGDAVAGICWSGDITVLNAEVGYERFKFALPDTGGTLWGDTFVVPMGSTRKANAEALMNYYYEPEVAAEVAAWVNYITPVVGAAEAAAELFPEVAENQLIFPDEETLSNAHIFRTLDAADDQAFNNEFQRVSLGA